MANLYKSKGLVGAFKMLASAGLLAVNIGTAEAGKIGDAIDALSCGGKAAMTEADKMTDEAVKQADAGQIQASLLLLRQSAGLYEKAYNCGYLEAGFPLAARLCSGKLGVEKDALRAHQIVLQLEASDKKQTMVKRTDNLRKFCGLPVPNR